MKTVSVAILKQKLSEYLHYVEQGDEVVVTFHRRPIALLTCEDDKTRTIRPPAQPLSALSQIRGVKVSKPLSTLQTLLHDRGGTLDAIYLASAMHIRDTLGLDAFLTHDAQLAAVAAASGFAVQGA